MTKWKKIARVADWIVGNMPKHNVYLELFCGSAAVLLNKKRSHIETINDLCGEVVNFFQVLRDKPQELIRGITLSPYSREEYYNSYIETTNEVERARRFCVRCWMGIGNSNTHRSGYRASKQATSPNPAGTWAVLPEELAFAAERLRGVQIECLPAIEILEKHNVSDVFVYADPPYVQGTRKSNIYKHEMTDKDHIELLQALLQHPGPVMISGYDNDIYSQYLSDWRKIQKETLADAGQKRIETLWMNYKDNQMDIYDIWGYGGC